MHRLRLRTASHKEQLRRPFPVAYTTSRPASNHRGTTEQPRSAPSFPARPFNKILIANRGEIARRVIRTAKRLGVKTVAIYSDADHDSLHVQEADEAYHIGNSPASDSYLNVENIIQAVQDTGAEAVHPGYGFLSENSRFAHTLAKRGLIFIGPPPSAIESMGSKSDSKNIMNGAGIPCVPGYHGDNQDPQFLKEKALEIGYPILIKAVMGGGGRGMRIVDDETAFFESLESAKRESLKSFGDDRVLLEKFITEPRHIEVQVFADMQGNAISLWERDCSVQRRHQKIIEEAPAPGLTELQRMELGNGAVKAAQAVGYVGAGTVEFIWDNTTGKFYFMEMNTRLQVEHPVTEMITGLDLVEWQLLIASGRELPLKQSDVVRAGHAIEARIYAENPRNAFLPDTGTITFYSPPQLSSQVRLDDGYCVGSEISLFYDSLIAKLIVHGTTRGEAVALMHTALAEFHIAGPSTNISFLRSVISNEHFVNAELETGFIARHYKELFPPVLGANVEFAIAAGLFNLLDSVPKARSLPWENLGLRCVSGQSKKMSVRLKDRQSDSEIILSITVNRNGSYNVSADLDGSVTNFQDIQVRRTGLNSITIQSGPSLARFNVTTSSARQSIPLAVKSIHVVNSMQLVSFDIKQLTWSEVSERSIAESGIIIAPMPSVVVDVKVKIDDHIRKGQPLVVLESMKTEIILRADAGGQVTAINCLPNQIVKEGEELIHMQVSKDI